MGGNEGDLNKLRETLMDSLVSKDDFSYLTKRVEILEGLTSTLSKEQEKTHKEIEEINKRLKALEDQLLNKVNCDQYDELMRLINQLMAANKNNSVKSDDSGNSVKPIDPTPVGPMISSKDINLIKEVASKIEDIETRLNTLSK